MADLQHVLLHENVTTEFELGTFSVMRDLRWKKWIIQEEGEYVNLQATVRKITFFFANYDKKYER